MDLLVERLGHSARLRPHSVLGMVWLQSHFEPCTWDLICSGAVRISRTPLETLCSKAEAAGLQIGHRCAADP